MDGALHETETGMAADRERIRDIPGDIDRMNRDADLARADADRARRDYEEITVALDRARRARDEIDFDLRLYLATAYPGIDTPGYFVGRPLFADAYCPPVIGPAYVSDPSYPRPFLPPAADRLLRLSSAGTGW